MSFLPDMGVLPIKLGWGVFSFFSPRELLSFSNLSLYLLLIILLYFLARRTGRRSEGGIRAFLLPSRLWKSPSAQLDVRYYLIIQPFFVLMIAPVVAWMQWSSGGVLQLCEQLFGLSPFPLNPTIGRAIYTLTVFLAIDFGFFYSHYLTHKYPALWCFHKVHHSAEVLVPFTALRFHPLDALWNVMFSACFVGILGGVCRYLFLPDATQFSLFGNHIIVALSYLTTHNLRHSHIWLNYPAWLTRWLISPAQHQLHHSCEARHIDKNFGYLLPFWDRWMGTSYVPVEQETFRLGIAHMPESGLRAHHSIQSLLLAPFLELADLWRNRQQGTIDEREPSPLKNPEQKTGF
ncbi:MAG: sterol desaturase family protein [Rickettsiales bacterium]|nr:sterol desaturase family protein [Rickettsiales bacterium]